jgi:hypothetical protein
MPPDDYLVGDALASGDTVMTTRRAFLMSSLAATALASSPLGAASALAQAQGPIGGIHVDVSRLVEQGWGANAGTIKAGMERELRTAFAGAIQRGGPVLVVKVRGIYLTSYAGNGGGRWGGGGGQNNDNLDSEAVLVGAGNRVLASYPVLSTISASYSGPWYLQDIDQRRIVSLIQNNVAWIKRYVAG